jgi:hypothetical protein
LERNEYDAIMRHLETLKAHQEMLIERQQLHVQQQMLTNQQQALTIQQQAHTSERLVAAIERIEATLAAIRDALGRGGDEAFEFFSQVAIVIGAALGFLFPALSTVLDFRSGTHGGRSPLLACGAGSRDLPGGS